MTKERPSGKKHSTHAARPINKREERCLMPWAGGMPGKDGLIFSKLRPPPAADEKKKRVKIGGRCRVEWGGCQQRLRKNEGRPEANTDSQRGRIRGRDVNRGFCRHAVA